MHPKIARYAYALFLKRKRKPVFKYLKWLRQTETYPLEALRKIQLERLKKIVKNSYESVPYYRETFDKINFKPEQLKAFDDLQKLPVLTKDIVRHRFGELIAQNHQLPYYLNYTSGSTGNALKFGRDLEAAAWYWAAEFRGPEWHGWKVGDKYAFFWGVPLDESKKGDERIKDFLLNRIRYSAHNSAPGYAESFYKKCVRFNPEFFWGYPSTIYRFAKILSEKNLDAQALKLKFIKTSSEMLYDFQREFIESVFGCKVRDDYGACETGHIAFECPNGNMHLAIENFCIEILNDNNKPVLDGERGKVIFTNLVNFAMPLIRYEIGDIAMLSDETCSCGVALPLIKEINGRAVDGVMDENGDIIHDSVLSYLMKGLLKQEKLDSVKHLKFIQKTRCEMLVQIVKGLSFSNSVIEFVTQQLHKILGSSINVTFEFLEEVPVERSGKLRYFVSQISQKEGEVYSEIS